MVYYVKINNETTYKLASWDAGAFNNDMTLTIQSTDFNQIKEDFYQIFSVSILQETQEISTYTCFDTFSGISYAGSLYIEGEKRFAECMQVTLSKVNLVEQVKRLDEQINPVVDVATMTLEEYKQYKIGQIHEAVHSDIYNGTQVVLSDGSVETFKFTTEDQLDIANLFNVIVTGKGKVTALPFHSTGHECRMYDAASLINLYIEMQKWITLKTTIANFAIVKVREAESKDAVDQIYYGMEFDTETTAKIDAIISATLTVINTIIEEIGGEDTENNNETNEIIGEENE